MNPLLEQVFALLDTDVGSLVYHLVLAFSIAGALQLCLGHSQFGQSDRLRRALVGLVLMLLTQVIQFAISGLVWQGLINGGTWLPVIDRVVMLFNLVLIIWMWAFPDPSPMADATILIVTLLVLASGVMGALTWAEGPTGAPFNGTWQDIAAMAISLGMILIGAVILLSRQSDGWGYGLSMMGLLAAGNVLHLLLLPYGQNVPIALRLGQIAAFPFLLLIPQRAGSALAVTAAPQTESLSLPESDLLQSGAQGSEPQLWQAMLKISAETNTDRVSRLIVNTLSTSLKADICLLLLPPDESGNFVMQCGYDQHNKKYYERETIESAGLPMLNASIRLGRTRRLTLHTTSPDMVSLARLLSLEKTGPLLFIPVLASGSKPVAGFLLLSPYSENDWNPDEQALAGLLARVLVQFLQRSQEMTSMKAEISQVRQSSRLTQEQLQTTLEEHHKLRAQFKVLQENAEQDRSHLASMSAMVADFAGMQDSLESLRIENETLQSEAGRLTEQLAKRETPAQAELRMALEEIAHLNNAIADADRRLNTFKMAPPTVPAAREQLNAVAVIAQDLRQPLSSIVGYTDVLLGESLGILGKNQQKYLERIKISTERIDRLLEDLLQVSAFEVQTDQLDVRTVELANVITEAIHTANPGLRQKKIGLQVDIPEKPVRMQTDQEVLKKVLACLLTNAGLVSPQAGKVTVSAKVETTDGEADFILLQVTDEGQGISSADLPRVFTPRSGQPIPGVGDNGTDLSTVKTLVEILGGRTWVDSEPGHGAVFSVLLPLAANHTDVMPQMKGSA